jgi:hypothetical protein
MLITPTQIQATLDRHQDVRAAVARDCLIAVTTQSTPSTTPRLAGRIRSSLRHAVASLLLLASIV